MGVERSKQRVKVKRFYFCKKSAYQIKRKRSVDQRVSTHLDPKHTIATEVGLIKVRKTARVRNRYKQVPDMSQDTKWESNKITINNTNKSQEVSPFPFR